MKNGYYSIQLPFDAICNVYHFIFHEIRIPFMFHREIDQNHFHIDQVK